MSRAKRTTAVDSEPRRPDGDEVAARSRILEAAFEAFRERGYAATSTLDIATRARVSKRELYTLVGNKQEMLLACIQARSRRLQVPADLPQARDREGFEGVLASFGAQLLREVSEPTVVAMFRLAIGEAVHAPEVARALDAVGREAARSALRSLMVRARASGLIDARPAECAERFYGLLWGDLMIGLLLGIAQRPSARELERRAQVAAAAFLRLHPAPASTPEGDPSLDEDGDPRVT